MDTAAEAILGFIVAAGLGAVIGLERQVSRPADDDVDYGGARTFALYAVWGAGAGFLADRYGSGAFAVAAAAFGALLVAEYYFAGVRRGDAGTTTEAAAFATFIVGALVWGERPIVALAVAVGITALLRAKAAIHTIVERFSESDLRAALRFGVLTAVILPIVPNQDYGPFDAFNPREIWLMVVFVAAIGLAGYIALRLLGSRGLGITGLLGGLVSSTAVTLGFSRMSASDPGLVRALSAGILAASGLMYARVLVEAGVVASEMIPPLIAPLLGLFLFVQGIAWWMWRGAGKNGDAESDFEVKNPITLTSALQFGALYGAVVFVSKALVDQVSERSLNIVGAVSGINDVDAITLSTANLVRDGLDPTVGARVVIIAAVVNTLVKGGMAVVLGSRALGLRVGGVLGVAAAAGFVIWLVL